MITQETVNQLIGMIKDVSIIVIPSVVSIVVTRRSRTKIKQHIDTTVEKGVDSVKKEMQRRSASMPAFGVEVAFEPEVQGRSL